VQAWATYERAEIRAEAGDLKQAQEDLRTASDLVPGAEEETGAPDFELRGNLARLEADLFWQETGAAAGRIADVETAGLAFSKLGEALLNALECQLVHKQTRGPDIYTRAFYDEMGERIAWRLRELAQHASTRPLVAPLVDALGQLWEAPPELPGQAVTDPAGWVRRTKPSTVARALFPHLPPDGELTTDAGVREFRARFFAIVSFGWEQNDWVWQGAD